MPRPRVRHGGTATAENYSRTARSSNGPPQDHFDAVVGTEAVRAEMFRLPREIHRRFDERDVHGASASLVALFDILSSSSSRLRGSFPLAVALASSSPARAVDGEEGGGGGSVTGMGSIAPPSSRNNNDALLETQMKMVYLHVVGIMSPCGRFRCACACRWQIDGVPKIFELSKVTAC